MAKEGVKIKHVIDLNYNYNSNFETDDALNMDRWYYDGR